jgi:hypothetical protein
MSTEFRCKVSFFIYLKFFQIHVTLIFLSQWFIYTLAGELYRLLFKNYFMYGHCIIGMNFQVIVSLWQPL